MKFRQAASGVVIRTFTASDVEHRARVQIGDDDVPVAVRARRRLHAGDPVTVTYSRRDAGGQFREARIAARGPASATPREWPRADVRPAAPT